jgi:hypothetical protein
LPNFSKHSSAGDLPFAGEMSLGVVGSWDNGFKFKVWNRRREIYKMFHFWNWEELAENNLILKVWDEPLRLVAAMGGRAILFYMLRLITL